MRPFLAWFQLLTYLLVVGAGLRVGRPAEPRFSAAHPYQHSKACQQRNYLRLDCFEHCNGPQSAATEKLPDGSGLHFLAQLKGLDVHCAFAALPAPGSLLRPLPVPGRQRPARCLAAVAAGFGNRDYPPPRRG
jgi:hypothetical protein